jgi:DNA-binding HxlR family transcriptional regulator
MDSPSSALCPQVEAAFALLAKKWAGLILFSLSEGERYFSELAASIPGISARLLTLRIRELEEAGLIVRMISEGSPVRVSYALSEKGLSLSAILVEVANWARN